jgi:uncharacterized cupin superfamily protein
LARRAAPAYNEEWLLVVDGMERGVLVCLPSGPAGAHQIINRSELPARTLMFSSSRVPAVSVYPHSNKVGVWPGNEADEVVFRRDNAVSWAEGEEGFDQRSRTKGG